MNEECNVVSLFSGCGGLELGFFNSNSDNLSSNLEHSSFNLVWSNSMSKESCRTVARNFGVSVADKPNESKEGTVFHGCISRVDIEKSISSDIDVILGRLPDDQSNNHTDLTKEGLCDEFAKCIEALNPAIFIVENGSGLVSDVNGYTSLHSGKINTSNIGIPYEDEHSFLICIRDDLVKDVDVEQKVKEISKNLSNLGFQTYPITPLEIFNGQPLDVYGEEYEKIIQEYEEYIDDLESNRALFYRNSILPQYSFEVWSDYFWRNGVKCSENSEATDIKDRIIELHDDLLAELGYLFDDVTKKSFEDKSNKVQNNGKDILKRIPPYENYEMVINTEYYPEGKKKVYQKIHPLEPFPSNMVGEDDVIYHYNINRGKLTNREISRLKTYPDDFLFDGRDNDDIREQISLSIPPLAGKRIGEQISDVIFNC